MSKPISFCVIGHPIGHSLSPALHITAGSLCDVDLSYCAYEVLPENLGKAIDGVRALRIDGLNVTTPHKVAVMKYLDDISEEARLTQAVNTIVNRDGNLTGYNTDVYGFMESLRSGGCEDVHGKSVFVYGCGGAARAVAIGLARDGVSRLTLCNRTTEKAKRLATQILTAFPSVDVEAYEQESNKTIESFNEADIIVNASTLGMQGFDVNSTLPWATDIRPESMVVDLVYKPLDTKLLRIAREKGAKTVDGLWMLIHQGSKAFNLWTGKEFPAVKVRKKLMDRLKAENKHGQD